MPASGDQPSSPPKRRAPKPNRIIALLILFVAIGIFFHFNQGAPTTVVVQAQPTPTQTPFTSTPSTEAPTPVSPEPETLQPQPVPTPTPWATPSEPGFGTAAPATPEDVAALVGGSPDAWSKHDEQGNSAGDNGWVYRGSSPLQFAIPNGLVVDTSQGRREPGAQVNATAFTIYWVG